MHMSIAAAQNLRMHMSIAAASGALGPRSQDAYIGLRVGSKMLSWLRHNQFICQLQQALLNVGRTVPGVLRPTAPCLA
jgi:hypothetical protein